MRAIEILTQEQKESIYDFVVDYIKKGNQINIDKDDFSFDIGKIYYRLYMSVFDKKRLYSICIMNFDEDISITAKSSEILNEENIVFITDYVNSLTKKYSVVDDYDFSRITNIHIDKKYDRRRKILKLKGKI